MTPVEVISLFLVKMYPMPATSWLPSHPIGVLVMLATPVKNYLKWWEIQLTIQCAVDKMNYFEQLQILEKHMQVAPIILEIY